MTFLRSMLLAAFIVVAGCATHAPPTSHRPTAVACGPSPTPSPPLACATQSDCPVIGSQIRYCVGGMCTFDQCAIDDDCGGGFVCACAGTTFAWSHTAQGTRCVAAGCRVDADCGPGGYCSPTTAPMDSFNGVAGYQCHTAMDTCTNDSDCGGDGAWNAPYCAYGTGSWSCYTGSFAG